MRALHVPTFCPPPHFAPLVTDTCRAVQNGASNLAETFLFVVGAGLVLGETYRTSRKNEKRRDQVADRLDSLEEEIHQLRGMESEQVKALQER